MQNTAHMIYTMIFTAPNQDTNSHIILKEIKKFIKTSNNAYFVKESYFDTGLIVAHEGMVVNNKNIIHASSEYGKTVNMDFMEYYFRSDGPLFDGVLFYSFHTCKVIFY